MKFSIICIRIWIDYCHVEWRNISRQWPTDKKYQYSQPQWLFWFSTILVFYHRHFHVITGTSTWFRKIPSSKFGDYRHLYFGAVGFTYLYSDKQICRQRNCIQDKIRPIYFSFEYFGLTSKLFQKYIVRIYGKFWRILRVIKKTMSMRVEWRSLNFNKIFEYFIFYLKRQILVFLFIFRQSQVAPDVCHNPIISFSAELPVIVYQVCYMYTLFQSV